MKWFRLYHSVMDSVRVRGMPERAQLAYLYLLCCAAEYRERTGKNSGATGLDISRAAWRMREPMLSRYWEDIEGADLAHLCGDGLIVVNDWENKQMRSDDAADRKRRSRDKSRDKSQESPVREGDTDTEKATPTPLASVPLPDWLPTDTWKAFLDMRKKIKKPLGDHGQRLVLAKLERLRAVGEDVKAMLDDSIEHCWQTVWPKGAGKSENTFKPSTRVALG